MTVLPNGTIWLEKGDVVPVFCDCGHIYQPDADDIEIGCSFCAKCGAVNSHKDCPPVGATVFERSD